MAEKRAVPSNAGIKFYISTVIIKDNKSMLMAGIHFMPFEKPYMVAFTMIGPVDRNATRDNETSTQVFNSFRILGERAIK